MWTNWSFFAEKRVICQKSISSSPLRKKEEIVKGCQQQNDVIIFLPGRECQKIIRKLQTGVERYVIHPSCGQLGVTFGNFSNHQPNDAFFKHYISPDWPSTAFFLIFCLSFLGNKILSKSEWLYNQSCLLLVTVEQWSFIMGSEYPGPWVLS